MPTDPFATMSSGVVIRAVQEEVTSALEEERRRLVDEYFARLDGMIREYLEEVRCSFTSSVIKKNKVKRNLPDWW